MCEEDNTGAMNAGRTEYRLLWHLENFSYIEEYDFLIESPQFTIEGLERTSWFLGLDPYELVSSSENDSAYLKRSNEDEGPVKIGIKFEMIVSTVDGSILYSKECEHNFGKGDAYYFYAFVDVDKLFVRRNGEFLPKDTVVVSCRMWRGEGSAEKVTQCTARTGYIVEKMSFLLKVENFSTLAMDEKTFEVPSLSKTGCSVSASLEISKGDDESIIVLIDPDEDRYELDTGKLSLIDASGNTLEVFQEGFGRNIIVQDGAVKEKGFNEEVDVQENIPKFTRQLLLSNQKNYLPNDELTLMCELIFSYYEQKVEEFLRDIPMATYLEKYRNAHFKNGNKVIEQSVRPNAPENGKVVENDHFQSNEVSKEKNYTGNIAMPLAESNQMEVINIQKEDDKLPFYPNVTDDLEALYIKQLLTDVVLKTSTTSFPAHKLILCVRSSVFGSLLTDNTQCIQVDDLEDETVRRLLLFLYSDSLEDLQCESALKLYYAADKYGVETLKEFCSVFLVNNISTSNAIELLLLAEKHGDAELRKLCEDFISAHEEEVYSSEEWWNLSETNPQLANQTMLLKYKRGK